MLLLLPQPRTPDQNEILIGVRLLFAFSCAQIADPFAFCFHDDHIPQKGWRSDHSGLKKIE
jgi:hypothetical protein